jgi:alpha-ketoglutarate-dependent 2,4-dichlorophenoxyacetate dioxygenase
MDLLGVSNVGEGEELLAADDRRRPLDMGNKFWHTDSSFKDIPAHLSMLYGVRVATSGGETQFADLRAGYDTLSDDMKRLAHPLVALHSAVHSRRMMGFDEFTEGLRDELEKTVAHDVVRELPETGRRTLYLSSHASGIVGLPVPVGRVLLHELIEHATSPDNVFTHNWRENDLVIWDNRCTMHRLRRYKASTDARVLRRVTTQDPAFPARDPAKVIVPDWLAAEAA